MERKYRIYIVEDDEWYSKLLKHTLELDPDHVVSVFHDADDALRAIDEGVDLVTIDYRLPGIQGDELLKRIKKKNAALDVIVISEQEDIEVAVDLMKHGAFDYLVKSKDIKQQLLRTIELVKRQSQMRDRIDMLESELSTKYDYETQLIGESEAMQAIHKLIKKAIKTDINVIITGETGTGKELVAKTIHYNSPFSKGPFIALNISAIPRELIESELFGHVKGAFTGATSDRAGTFERAANGTLLLDEIGELDMPLQAKLLRVLQEREFVRVGGDKTQKVNCRILVATNKDLVEEVKEGRFRKDLFYRFFGITVELPPLRNRGKDILMLAERFIENHCEANGIEVKQLSKGAIKRLMDYRYPGNVRELRSVVELAIALADEEVITEDDIQFPEIPMSEMLFSEERTMREYERLILDHYLDKYDNDVPLVSKILDIGKSTIYRMLKE